MAKYFINSSLLLLGVAGFAKIIASMGETPALRDVDPLFEFLTNRQVAFIVGLIEVATAVSLFLRTSPVIKLLMICSLGLMFSSYRLGLWIVGAKKPCGCLGDLGNWVGLSPSATEVVTRCLLGAMLAGSIAYLWRCYMRPEGTLQPCPNR